MRRAARLPVLAPAGVPRARRRAAHARGAIAALRLTQYLAAPSTARAHPGRPQGGPPRAAARRARQPLAHLLRLRRSRGRISGRSRQIAAESVPMLEISDDDGTVHRLFRVCEPGRAEAVTDAIGSSPITIADGHHRYETALAYRDERRAADGDPEGGRPYDFAPVYLAATTTPACMSSPPTASSAAVDRSVGASARAAGRALGSRAARRRCEALERAASLGIWRGGVRRRARARQRRAAAARAPARRGPARRSTWPRPARWCSTTCSAWTPTRLPARIASHTPPPRRRLGARRGGAPAERGRAARAAPSLADVEAVARGRRTMPPKSTFFFPKILDGMVFNQLDRDPGRPSAGWRSGSACATPARGRAGVARANRANELGRGAGGDRRRDRPGGRGLVSRELEAWPAAARVHGGLGGGRRAALRRRRALEGRGRSDRRQPQREARRAVLLGLDGRRRRAGDADVVLGYVSIWQRRGMDRTPRRRRHRDGVRLGTRGRSDGCSSSRSRRPDPAHLAQARAVLPGERRARPGAGLPGARALPARRRPGRCGRVCAQGVRSVDMAAAQLAVREAGSRDRAPGCAGDVRGCAARSRGALARRRGPRDEARAARGSARHGSAVGYDRSGLACGRSTPAAMRSDALAQVIDPEIRRNVVELGMVDAVTPRAASARQDPAHDPGLSAQVEPRGAGARCTSAPYPASSA